MSEARHRLSRKKFSIPEWVVTAISGVTALIFFLAGHL